MIQNLDSIIAIMESNIGFLSINQEIAVDATDRACMEK
jgi:hypothetical protein